MGAGKPLTLPAPLCHFLECQTEICATAGVKWDVNSRSGSGAVSTIQGGNASAGLLKACLRVALNPHLPNVLPHYKTNALLQFCTTSN